MSEVDWDVMVVGGGFAGVAAAATAARSGAETLLVEKDTKLGGNVTQAYVHTICGLYEMDVDEPRHCHRGFPVSFSRQLLLDGLATDPESVGRVFVQPIFPETMGKYLLDFVGRIPGLDCRLNNELLGVNEESDGLHARIEETGSGKVRDQTTATLVDASGDAVIQKPSPDGTEDPKDLQLPSLIFTVEGMEGDLSEGYDTLKLNRDVAEGVKDGDLPKGCESILIRPGRQPGQAYITLNLPRDMAGQYNPFDPEVLEEFRGEARRRAALLVGYLRKSRAELSKLSIGQFPNRIGIRETRQLRTRYTLTEEDVLQGRTFEDGVTTSAWPIELWEDYTGAEMRYPNGPVQIPLRALLSEEHDRVGTAGRCLGATHRAASATRVLGTALATGQAIGMASALAADRETTLGDIEAASVRDALDQLEGEDASAEGYN